MANTVLYQHFPSVTVYSPKLQWLQRNNLHTLISRELERRCFFQGLLIPIFCHSQLGCLVLSSTSKCISQYQKILVSPTNHCKSGISTSGKRSSKLPHLLHYWLYWKCKIWRVCRDFIIISVGYCSLMSIAFASFNVWRSLLNCHQRRRLLHMEFGSAGSFPC